MIQLTKTFLLLLMASFIIVGCERFDNVNPLNNSLTQEDIQGKWFYEHSPPAGYDVHSKGQLTLTLTCDRFTLVMETVKDIACLHPEKAVIQGNFELEDEKIHLNGHYEKEEVKDHCQDKIPDILNGSFVEGASFDKSFPVKFEDGKMVLNPENDNKTGSLANFSRVEGGSEKVEGDEGLGYYSFRYLPLEKIEDGECEEEL